MTSGFVPLARPLANRVRTRSAEDLRFAHLALAAVIVLEFAALFFPQAMLVSPIQTAVLFKRFSGYSMITLLVFAMAFGWLRRLQSMSSHQNKLNLVHQGAGLSMLLLLACHVGAQPSGFLLFLFHAMAIGLGAGALRAVLGQRISRQLSTALLALHIGLACLVSASVLLHLYFVYAYMA